MKKSELHREWARVLDMCEGTKVDPIKCWKLVGKLPMYYPDFGADPMKYEFAVAILENKPVFFGDVIYSLPTGIKREVSSCDVFLSIDKWSWNPPKKTFMLNGEELPCPVNPEGLTQATEYSICVGGYWYYFSSAEESLKFREKLNKVLSDNTK